jgi:hypothetical protein
MSKRVWLTLLLTALVIGIVTTVHAMLGGIVAGLAGLYLFVRLWYRVEHPVTWQYEAWFWAAVLGVALGAVGVYAAACATLPPLGITTPGCRTVRVGLIALWLVVMMVLMTSPPWLYLRFTLWRWLRRERKNEDRDAQ